MADEGINAALASESGQALVWRYLLRSWPQVPLELGIDAGDPQIEYPFLQATRAMLALGVVTNNDDSKDVRAVIDDASRKIIQRKPFTHTKYDPELTFEYPVLGRFREFGAFEDHYLDGIFNYGRISAETIAADFSQFEAPWDKAPLDPNGATEGLVELLRKWAQTAPSWAFWLAWFERFLKGDPLPWDLQREIALIDKAIWEAGAEPVAKEIAQIEARFEILQRIEDLEKERDSFRRQIIGVGHNLPPEPIETELLVHELRTVQDAIDSIKDEASKEQPNKSRLKGAVEVIAAVLKEILKWTASKADLAVETMIKWGIPAGCVYLVSNPDKLEAVLTAARALLKLP